MSFKDFQYRVRRIVRHIKGQKPRVYFHHDSESGKHYANFSDGTTIIGNTVAKNVMVCWDSGHSATATI